MPFEYALQTSGSYDAVLEAARWAEQEGLAAFALPDHYLFATEPEPAKTTPALDAFASLAGLARETTTIALSVLVSPITFRHPAVLAKSAVTIDQMSGGRFTLGIGTGWMDREHEVFGFRYPEFPERFEMMEEALAYVRAAFDPNAPGYKGSHYSLEPFPISPGARPPGVVVGGTGKRKTPELAGQYADELNAYPASPDEWAAKVRIAKDAASAAGRDPDALLLSSSAALLVADTESEFKDRLGAFAARSHTTPEAVMAHLAHRSAPHGTFDQVREQLEGLAGAGMSRFYLQSLGPFNRDDTERILRGLQG